MNKTGQQNLGMLIIVAVAVIVGVVLFQVIAQEVGSSTTVETANSSETLAANGASIYLEEYKSIASVVIVNASNQAETIAAGNYTVTNNAIDPTTGALSVQIQTDDAEYASTAVYVQGTAEPVTYISSSGGRAVAGLITVFFALAVLATAMLPVIKDYM